MERAVLDLSRVGTGARSDFSFFDNTVHYVPMGAHFVAHDVASDSQDAGISYGDSINASELADDFAMPASEMSHSCPEHDDCEGDWSLSFYSQEREDDPERIALQPDFDDVLEIRKYFARPSRHDPRLLHSSEARRRLLYSHEPPLTPPGKTARDCSLHTLLTAVSEVVRADASEPHMRNLVENLRTNFYKYVSERGWCRDHKIKDCVLCAFRCEK